MIVIIIQFDVKRVARHLAGKFLNDAKEQENIALQETKKRN